MKRHFITSFLSALIILHEACFAGDKKLSCGDVLTGREVRGPSPERLYDPSPDAETLRRYKNESALKLISLQEGTYVPKSVFVVVPWKQRDVVEGTLINHGLIPSTKEKGATESYKVFGGRTTKQQMVVFRIESPEATSASRRILCLDLNNFLNGSDTQPIKIIAAEYPKFLPNSYKFKAKRGTPPLNKGPAERVFEFTAHLSRPVSNSSDPRAQIARPPDTVLHFNRFKDPRSSTYVQLNRHDDAVTMTGMANRDGLELLSTIPGIKTIEYRAAASR